MQGLLRPSLPFSPPPLSNSSPSTSVHADNPLSPSPLSQIICHICPKSHLDLHCHPSAEKHLVVKEGPKRRKANPKVNTNSILSISISTSTSTSFYIALSQKLIWELVFYYFFFKLKKIIISFLLVFHTAESTAPDLILGWLNHKR